MGQWQIKNLRDEVQGNSIVNAQMTRIPKNPQNPKILKKDGRT